MIKHLFLILLAVALAWLMPFIYNLFPESIGLVICGLLHLIAAFLIGMRGVLGIFGELSS